MRLLLSLSFAAGLIACASNPPPPPPPPAATPAPSPDPTPEPVAEPEPPPAPVAPTPAVKFAEGLSTPESVLYDAANDRYLVSNINGSPVEADNNGFIAILSPEGTITTLKWIAGGSKKVTLNAPKGMAIAKGVLYVSDLDRVRMFDAKSGAPKGEIKLPGATFTNDVAASADGSKIYVSDSGVTMDASGFKPSGTDAVWVIEKGKARALIKSPDLGRPNGLLLDGTSVWVACFGSNEIYAVDDKGAKSAPTALPSGGLDGFVRAGDKVLVSSWDGQRIFIGTLGGEFTPLFEGLQAPADIGFDTKRSRVLVPRFMDNVVEAYDLPK